MRGRGVACMVSPDNNRLSLSRVCRALYMREKPHNAVLARGGGGLFCDFGDSPAS